MSRSFTVAGALAASLVFVPVLPGLALIVPPLLQGETWLAFWRDSQWPEALMTTLVSTTLSVGGALLLALIILCTLYPGERWQRYLHRLPLLLALPHVALASGFFFLFSDSGWLARLLHLSLPPDNYGIVLGLMLALKETWFLLWFSASQLPAERVSRQITLSKTLGYGELQSRLYVLVPQLLPRLGWSFAEGWFYPALLPASFTLSGWQQVVLAPVWTSFVAGFISALLAPIVTILWLKGCPRRYDRWVYLPLLLPALPLAAGQDQLLLRLNMDGTWAALIWSHLLWIVPYTLLILAPAWQRIDARLVLTARTFGWSPGKILCLVQVPLLVRPLLAALAVGFSVSIAQYLPTLYAGAGRFATVTTEAVALSSGGDPQQFAIQALLQMLLPMAVFIATLSVSRQAGTNRKGLR